MPTTKTKYKVEHNPKIGKAQIKFEDVNVAVAEFYENTASSRDEIGLMLTSHDDLLGSLRAFLSAVTLSNGRPVDWDALCERGREAIAKATKAPNS